MQEVVESVLKKKKTQKPQKSKKIHTKMKKPSEADLITDLQAKYDSIDISSIKTFKDVPLSPPTVKGLQKYNFKTPTEIQIQTIKYSLKGEDILGAAQTGSGKTLAFIIPLLEILYCNQWTRYDGVGALVITPTRELAYQIFAELRKVGEFHDFSAGLIIGGKDLKFEKDRMDQCNIVICTPGRLLHHMDMNPMFHCDNMKILILDEADKILDMGFASQVNAIVGNLPPVRQTLLFSATQTKSVKDLARLSLNDPRYVAVHESKEYCTPTELKQSYIVCDLHEKISVLYSFIRNHVKSKAIIFFSSCKQAKYVHEIFCKLRPGISLLALYGSMHQLRRMEIYDTFCKKSHAILFATDLASRGLDIPHVNWVVQADCPEDVETYIHRVGRTARFNAGGESLLLLLPSELPMIDILEKHKIPIEKIDINAEKMTNPVRKIEAYLAKDPALKESAKRAFQSYFKAIHLMKLKSVFKVRELDTDAFARSLGLVISPRLRFLDKLKRKDGVQVNEAPMDSKEQNEDRFTLNGEKRVNKINKLDANNSDEDAESDDDMLLIKRADHDIEMPDNMEELAITGRKKSKPLTKAALAKKMLNKQIVPNKKIIFDDDGEAVIDSAKQKKSEVAQAYENEDEHDEVGGINIEKAKLMLKEEDHYDKQLFKEKVKAKKQEAKRKLKEQKRRLKDEADEDVDDFGTDEDEEGSEPNLSWLPDPDKIFGPATDDMNREFFDKGNELNDGSVHNVESSDEQNLVPAKVKQRKRKVATENTEKPKKKKKLSSPSALNVNEAEELAMLLLHK